MSDQIHRDSSESAPENKKQFIRETVNNPHVNRKRIWLVRMAIIVCSAILFGVIACLSFVLSEPWMKRHFGTVETVKETVVIPRDETEAETTEQETTEDSLDQEELRKEVSRQVREQVSAYLSTMEIQLDQNNVDEGQLLKDLQLALECSLVQVTSRSAAEDVFRNTFTRKEQTFGVVTAKTDDALLILTENGPVKDAGVVVTVNNESLDAELCAVDSSLDMAVLRVNRDSMTPETWELVQPVVLGNSYGIQQGDYVAAFGTPMGEVGSALIGSVSYLKQTQQSTDLNFRLIQTDMACDSQATGILVNENGAVIGWISQSYNTDSMSGMLAAISISELKGVIEKLSNGSGYACMGIQYLEVDGVSAEEQGIPRGIYVTRCNNGSPAFEAGLQNGDILTAIDDESVEGATDFRRIMEAKDPGDTVQVTVMRQGRDTYEAETLELELTAR